MNIFEQLKKAPKVEINETSYGAPIHMTDIGRMNSQIAARNRKPRKCRLIEGKSIPEWAEHYNVSRDTIYRRIDTYGSPNIYQKNPAGNYLIAVVIEGKTVKQWAEHYGMSAQGIRDRLSKHGTPHSKVDKL